MVRPNRHNSIILLSFIFLLVLSQLGLAGTVMAATGSGHSPLFSMNTIYLSGVLDGPAIPHVYRLSTVYPNPFNPSTTISYDLPHTSVVHLTVFDMRGRVVRTLRNGVSEPAGRQTAIWNGCDDQNHQVSGGMYLCRLRAGNFTATTPMTLVK